MCAPASKAGLSAALLEWLDCEDDQEVIEAEAEQAEEDMEACLQWQAANKMAVDNEQELTVTDRAKCRKGGSHCHVGGHQERWHTPYCSS